MMVFEDNGAVLKIIAEEKFDGVATLVAHASDRDRLAV